MTHHTTPLPVHGTVALRARWEEWMSELVADPQQVSRLTSEYGSPVNVLNPAPLGRNAQELLDAGASHGVDTQVFFARKANKALCFVDAAREAGLGVDVASENELRQVLNRGVAPERIILSAAIKTDALLRLAIDRGVTISCDSRAEAERIAALAKALNHTAHVAPRLAPNPDNLPPTRFGELLHSWQSHAWPETIHADGVHVHLHGYSESDRRTALAEAIDLVEHLRLVGQPASFIDIGGGVPMSYLESREQWEYFQERIAAQRAGTGEPFTWKSDPPIPSGRRPPAANGWTTCFLVRWPGLAPPAVPCGSGIFLFTWSRGVACSMAAASSSPRSASSKSAPTACLSSAQL